MHELDRDSHERVRPLLCRMQHNLIMTAVVEGSSPGRVWVDDAADPHTTLMSTPEGHFLAGEQPTARTRESLRQLIVEDILPQGRAQGWTYFCLHYPDRRWEEFIADFFPSRSLAWDYQRYFVLKELKIDWRIGLPEGSVLRRVDEGLLGRESLKNVHRLKGWACGSFGSVAGFLKRGFGFCLVHERDIVSWCISDCVSGHRCEVGIHTDERYRRRGFAKRTVAATVEHCLSNGLTKIGWHCWSSNVASAATASAVGFAKVLDHPGLEMYLREKDNA